MEEDIKILKDMRDNIYGAMQFEDDYQVSELEEKQFHALNLAIKAIARNKELESALNNSVSKDEIKAKIEEYKKDYDRQSEQELYNLTKITAGKISSLQELLNKGE